MQPPSGSPESPLTPQDDHWIPTGLPLSTHWRGRKSGRASSARGDRRGNNDRMMIQSARRMGIPRSGKGGRPAVCPTKRQIRPVPKPRCAKEYGVPAGDRVGVSCSRLAETQAMQLTGKENPATFLLLFFSVTSASEVGETLWVLRRSIGYPLRPTCLSWWRSPSSSRGS